MYAVIKTGGKQYRVRAGDLLVVEKLDGEVGAKLAFEDVLAIGEGAAVTIGAPTVAGASVSATLIETRKGRKIKVFKKIRRQGYRRTQGHRQFQSVLRITALAAGDKSETWDGEVDLTPLAQLNARARNLARGMEAALTKRGEGPAAKVAPTPAKAPAAAAASAKAGKGKTAKPVEAKTEAAPPKAKASKADTKKAEAKTAPAKKAEPPKKPGKAAAAPAKAAAVRKPEVKKPEAKKPAAKKPAAKKAPAKSKAPKGKA